jgi:predicted DNA-binding transcriptional regulator YafY
VARGSGRVRTYRVSRVLEVQTLDERFERPDGFDLAASWRVWSRRFETAMYGGQAVVRVAPGALDRLHHLLGPVRARAALESAGPAGEDGWSSLVVPIESVEQALADLLRLGADAEVVAPPELRRRMAETARALAGIYGAG